MQNGGKTSLTKDLTWSSPLAGHTSPTCKQSKPILYQLVGVLGLEGLQGVWAHYGLYLFLQATYNKSNKIEAKSFLSPLSTSWPDHHYPHKNLRQTLSRTRRLGRKTRKKKEEDFPSQFLHQIKSNTCIIAILRQVLLNQVYKSYLNSRLSMLD